ncbi:sulfotransferase family 2 domain-containing protein [Defluviimonas sp. WL0002]|uniref:Sulfotransferase family 2 domain-containing protein n=1 Tax=Albidovulum marisflavi TaxID=2984159 RepID=A0ABT2ZG93_9RHOB|nr:sulfotransferase family 2 domain-containing protein [Defluviimonas sp. WL0002]MCV2870152.1 sulfotransferase family 2 domain-containing protein [Defluviimonas sp. WL0002]
MRTVICHYHIYKNSGTSFDDALARNFGAGHLSFDGPFPYFSIDRAQLDRIICRNPDRQAFSSHQIRLPVPASLDYRVLAATFVRNPFLRVASIWRFKRAHADGTRTSELARRMAFAEWLDHALSDPQEITHVSNAQTRILGEDGTGRLLMRRGPSRMEYDLEQARANLRNVALLGRTDHYEADLLRFSRRLDAEGISLDSPVTQRLNVTDASTGSVAQRVAALFEELPESLVARFVMANDQDVALCDHATRLIEDRDSP